MVTHAGSRLRHIARGVLTNSEPAANTEQPEWWKNKRAPNPLLPPRAISPASDVDEGMPDSTVPFLTPNDVTVREDKPSRTRPRQQQQQQQQQQQLAQQQLYGGYLTACV